MIFVKLQVLLTCYLVAHEQFSYTHGHLMYNATWYKDLGPDDFVNGGGYSANVCRGPAFGLIQAGYSYSDLHGCCHIGKKHARICDHTVEYLHKKDKYKWTFPLTPTDYAVVGGWDGLRMIVVCLTTFDNKKYVGIADVSRDFQCCTPAHEWRCNVDYEVLVRDVQACKKN